MKRQEILDTFDANDMGVEGVFFGLPFDEDSAQLILIPVPWEATVSYGAGTAMAPQEILHASCQVDLFDPDIQDAWQLGIYMPPIDPTLSELNQQAREEALKHLDTEQKTSTYSDKVNEASLDMVAHVEAQATKYLQQGKLVALLGGDHSTPMGLLQALAQRYDDFGILQIDAHADLRVAFEGFEYSHASIMYNVLSQLPQVKKLVQVGIRDFCEQEYQLMKEDERICAFLDMDLQEERYRGRTWHEQCQDIISQLPEYVYISFDIDGLDPKLCPDTGTPVPGGLEFSEVVYLIKSLVQAGKKIIAFDLVEVSNPPSTEWNANVAARLLYKLANWFAVSSQKLVALD